ncbi:unnamed protein product [Acanthosepion pharaonis]|uniref:Uncharacterized protein n=1 Tax=Acanthosepion pharaonis TaxID=158019 RepID=A0A812B6D6_ACAPH|nr:unnamed protein product [Sepia pharaonis]
MVECSPATRATRVRFQVDALFSEIYKLINILFLFFFLKKRIIFSLQVLLLFPSLFFSSLFPFFLSFFITDFHSSTHFHLQLFLCPPTSTFSSCLFGLHVFHFYFHDTILFFFLFLSPVTLSSFFLFPSPHHLLLRNFPSPPLCSSPSIFNCAFLLFCFHIFLFSSSWSPFIPLHISFILSISLIFFIFFFLSFSSLLFFFNYTFTFPHISLPFSFISSFLFFTPFFISFFSSSLSRPHFH